MTLSRVLIANRGEIAVRIIRACQGLGIESVLVVSEADRDSLRARLANRTVCIGPARAGDSYLNWKALVAAAQGTECDALHPGYGFLAESPEIAEACATNKIQFVGSTAEQIRRMGNKLEARALAAKSGGPPFGERQVQFLMEVDSIGRRCAIGAPVMSAGHPSNPGLSTGQENR